VTSILCVFPPLKNQTLFFIFVSSELPTENNATLGPELDPNGPRLLKPIQVIFLFQGSRSQAFTSSQFVPFYED
jgi:hypothetical protein